MDHTISCSVGGASGNTAIIKKKIENHLQAHLVNIQSEQIFPLRLQCREKTIISGVGRQEQHGEAETDGSHAGFLRITAGGAAVLPTEDEINE